MTDLPSPKQIEADVLDPLKTPGLPPDWSRLERIGEIARAYADGVVGDLTPIRRVKCPDCDGRGFTFSLLANEHGEVEERIGSDPRQCLRCDGHGWLYPDPPEWWWKDYMQAEKTWARSAWESFCDRMWRVLGMYEYGEADDGN